MKEFVILVIVLCPILVLSSAEAKLANGFTIDLIHRDSPLSPFYNSSITQTDAIINAAFRSISRVNHFNLTKPEVEKQAETALILNNNGDYLMKIFIGTPPVESLAVAATGSDLIWAQCLPCEQCYTQKAPIFNPKNSSTFAAISCDSESCNLLSHACGGSMECRYYYSYGDKSFTVGELASETISFGSNGGQLVASPKTIFGCGHDNEGKYTSTSTGLVGLGGGPLSLVSQLGDEIGHKFSYCLLPFSANSTSKLKFGSESRISRNGVVSTPLVTKDPSTYYYITLEGVSIGEKKVKTDQSAGNIVIDSGTTVTILESKFYNSFEAAVKEAIGDVHEPLQDPPEPFKLCYRNNASIENLPDVTFHFSGADILLKRMNTFVRDDNFLCLLMVPSERFSIFGSLAQVNFNVEYDLQRKMVSFAPADCTKE